MSEFFNGPSIDWAALRCIVFACVLFTVGYAIAHTVEKFK